jgi:hypothetical protein
MAQARVVVDGDDGRGGGDGAVGVPQVVER